MEQATGARAPLILEIRGNSLDDGPGIRSVVFFKGCPLSCLWCHNPEGRTTMVELAYDAAACIACETCQAACPLDALAWEHPHYVDRERCDYCFDCVEVCPSGALRRVGHERSVAEICQEVLKDRPFFDASGGGVTFSGGEPTLHLELLTEVAGALRAAGVHTLLETCGLFPWERFEAAVLPQLDAINFDLKIIDDEAHRRFCGASNRTILENLGRLAQRAEEVDLLVRVPLVPGITATTANLKAIAEILTAHALGRVKLLDYNPLWVGKAATIGATRPDRTHPGLETWMPAADVAPLRAIFGDHDIATT